MLPFRLHYSNPTNHELLLKNGGIQPLISLLYCQDVDVQTNACAAMRGLSVSAHTVAKHIVVTFIDIPGRLKCIPLYKAL